MTSRGSKYIYMFLFSDIIVLALKKSKSTKYKVLDVITLLTIRILNIPDTEGTSAAFMHPRVAHSLTGTTAVQSSRTPSESLEARSQVSRSSTLCIPTTSRTRSSGSRFSRTSFTRERRYRRPCGIIVALLSCSRNSLALSRQNEFDMKAARSGHKGDV